MSTRFKNPRAKFLRNVACLTLVSAAAAGCSEGAARFVDPLFTASVPQQPQQVSQLGGVAQVPAVASRIRQNVPQRLDVQQPQFVQQDAFNAKNLSRQANSTFRNAQPQQVALNQQYPDFPARPTLTQQTVSQPNTIARQSLPPVQQVPQSSTLASTPNNGGRLTLEQAQAINDPESVPQIGQVSAPNDQFAAAQTQASPSVGAPQQSFEVGTEWTRQYSPIPTESPAPKLSAAPAGQGPKAYTPPQGVYTADVDRLSTSSVAKFAEPKVIRSSIGSSPTKQVIRNQPVQIDRQVTASVPARPQQQAQRSNNGWSNAGGTYVNLKSGETLYSLSRRYGVPVDAISSSNGITNPSTVRVGQRILIPTYVYAPNVGVSAPDANKHVANASRQALPPQTISASIDPITTSSTAPKRPLPPKVVSNGQAFGAHTVQAGDTLSKIGRLHGASVASIKAANGITDGNVIKIGQVLSVPGSKHAAATASAKQSVAALPVLDRTVTGSVPSQPLPPKIVSNNRVVAAVPRSRPNFTPAQTVAGRSNTGQPQANPTRNQQVARNVTPAIDPITTSSSKKPTATSSSGFKWPVRGDVIGHFGQKNAGINIAVPEGTPVRAADAGEVIYAANGLADYGQLVLVRHSNGFVTAYAHNKSLLVKRGDRVRQGQVVAKSGKSGAVSSPQVHFEIREGKTPVNPMSHLAG